MNTIVIFKFCGVRLVFLHCLGTVITKIPFTEKKKKSNVYRGFIDNSILYAQWNYFDALRIKNFNASL